MVTFGSRDVDIYTHIGSDPACEVLRRTSHCYDMVGCSPETCFLAAEQASTVPAQMRARSLPRESSGIARLEAYITGTGPPWISPRQPIEILQTNQELPKQRTSAALHSFNASTWKWKNPFRLPSCQLEPLSGEMSSSPMPGEPRRKRTVTAHTSTAPFASFEAPLANYLVNLLVMQRKKHGIVGLFWPRAPPPAP